MPLLGIVLLVIAGLSYLLGRLIFRNEDDEGKRFWKGLLLTLAITISATALGVSWYVKRENHHDNRRECKGYQGLTLNDVVGKWESQENFYRLSQDGSMEASDFKGNKWEGTWRLEGSMLFLVFANDGGNLAYRICDCDGDEMCIRLHGESETTVIQRVE